MKVKDPIIDVDRLAVMPIPADNPDILIESAKARGLRFEEKDLEEVSFTEAVLDDVSFQSSKIKEMRCIDTIINKGNFAGTEVSRCYAHRARFISCRLQGAQFMETKISNVVYKNCKSDGVSFRYSKIENTVFTHCDLRESEFLGAELKNVRFDNCNMTSAQFSHAKLDHINLKGSNIEDIKIGKDSLGTLTVTTGQALYLASILGLHIED